MKHVLAYVAPNQTAKTVAKFFISGLHLCLWGPQPGSMSDRGANFMSSVIEEMCKILGVKKLQTMPYHPQTNGLVERLYQMIMQMIGKLEEEKKLTGHHIWQK